MAKKFKVTKTWENGSNGQSEKKSFRERFSQNIKKRIEDAKAEREYKKTPEYRQKLIDKVNQEAELEVAKAKKAKARSTRREIQMKPVKDIMGGTNIMGMGQQGKVGGGILDEPDTYSGFDSMFGYGSGGGGQSKSKPKKQPKQQWSGMNDLLGI